MPKDAEYDDPQDCLPLSTKLALADTEEQRREIIGLPPMIEQESTESASEFLDLWNAKHSYDIPIGGWQSLIRVEKKHLEPLSGIPKDPRTILEALNSRGPFRWGYEDFECAFKELLGRHDDVWMVYAIYFCGEPDHLYAPLRDPLAMKPMYIGSGSKDRLLNAHPTSLLSTGQSLEHFACRFVICEDLAAARACEGRLQKVLRTVWDNKALSGFGTRPGSNKTRDGSALSWWDAVHGQPHLGLERECAKGRNPVAGFTRESMRTEGMRRILDEYTPIFLDQYHNLGL